MGVIRPELLTHCLSTELIGRTPLLSVRSRSRARRSSSGAMRFGSMYPPAQEDANCGCVQILDARSLFTALMYPSAALVCQRPEYHTPMQPHRSPGP